MNRKIRIGEMDYDIEGDVGYIAHVQNGFEPDVVALLKSCCAEDSQVLDVGANIGMTSLALSQICPKGSIVAIEPVPRTFQFLQRNLKIAKAANVTALNFAAGAAEASLPMQANMGFLAGSFVSDKCVVEAKDHLIEVVPVKTLDKEFINFPLSRLDFMKVDVEGFELEVLEGAAGLLEKFRPTVLLEMNHWCLNMFRRMTLHEFREKLLSIFHCVYAIEKSTFLDFGHDKDWYTIAHEHIVNFKYINLLAGFDRADLLRKLEDLKVTASSLDLDSTSVTARLSDRVSITFALTLPRGWRVVSSLQALKSLVKRVVRRK